MPIHTQRMAPINTNVVGLQGWREVRRKRSLIGWKCTCVTTRGNSVQS